MPVAGAVVPVAVVPVAVVPVAVVPVAVDADGVDAVGPPTEQLDQAALLGRPGRVDPATTRLGPMALDAATRRPLLDGAVRRRSTLRYVLVGVLAIVAVVLLATRSTDRGNNVDAVGGASTTADAVVTETAPPEPTSEPAVDSRAERSEPTTPAPVTASSAPVVEAPAPIIDEASYLGRRKDDVIEELEALGYTVVERKVGPVRGAKSNTVVGIEPTGSLEAGTTITIFVAGGREDED